MTVQSYLREHSRPLLFVPVYIGYEKLMEGGSYTQELAGAAKRKGIGVGPARRHPRPRHEHYGEVGVSFARPIALGELLDAEGVRDMDNWLADKNLRRRTLTEAVAANCRTHQRRRASEPGSVVATALLATPKHAADAAQLADIVERLLRLAAQAHAPPEAVATTVSGRRDHPHGAAGLPAAAKPCAGRRGDGQRRRAVALTYFRNNVLHCFALPGLIACLIVQHGVIGKTKLARLSRELYVLLESGLYLPPWRAESAASAPSPMTTATGDRRLLAGRRSTVPAV